MLKSKTAVILGVLGGILFCVAGYVFLTDRLGSPTVLGPQLSPGDNNLPDNDIVFFVQNGVLGFGGLEGGDYITRTVGVTVKSLLRESFNSRLCDKVTWSPNGEYLAARYPTTDNPTAGVPVLISTQGKVLTCSQSSMYGDGRIWVISGTVVLATTLDPARVVLIDMATCSINTTLYAAPKGEFLGEAALSSKNWLAVSRGYIEQQGGIVIQSPDGAPPVILPGGMFPAWSSDGEWLAYYVYRDGIYVSKKDGSDKRKLVHSDTFTTPSWSPDGQWLVYDRVSLGQPWTIYKINLATEKEYGLFKAGGNPNWRWKIPLSQ